jgi:hypothetical protein
MCALRYGRAMTYVVLSGSVDSWNGMGCSIVLSREFCGLGLGDGRRGGRVTDDEIVKVLWGSDARNVVFEINASRS